MLLTRARQGPADPCDLSSEKETALKNSQYSV